MEKKKHMILASSSPRRRELLSHISLDFEIIPSKGPEIVASDIPSEVVSMLSHQKAFEVWDGLADKENSVVIGADTVVSVNGSILGKPADEADAYRMLKALSGRRHEVFTGVTVICEKDGEVREISFFECTGVSFIELDDEEINDYIASGEPMDKAGAYGIQDGSSIFVSGIEGDFYNVVGLPVCRLYRELKALGGII